MSVQPYSRQELGAFFAPAVDLAGQRVAGVPVATELFRLPHEQTNLNWVEELLATVEDRAASSLFREYQRRLKKYPPRSANIWLRRMVEQIRDHAARFPVPLRSIASELGRTAIAREWANATAAIINDCTRGFTQPMAAERLLAEAMGPARKWGISPLLPVLGDDISDDQLDLIASALARLQDADWWQRQITRAWRQYAEHVAIMVGKVRRGVSAYVSYQAAREHQERKRAGAAWVQTMFAVNEELGLEIPLAEAVKSSMANPELRRMELMVRMRGFEEVAEELGYVGEFYTWTAPSRFHAWSTTRTKKTVANARYDGSTPRQAQAYLCGQWAKARAKLARLGVKLFGFRVVEPHHDATPHWHLLLFTHPASLRLMRSVLRKYACEHHKQELGRKGYRARFDWQTIDPAKGSATGYIAKYIAKNIDGHQVDIDEETGTAASDTAANVAAWASLWGIRQFQQVGGPSVSVWRELRRLREASQHPVIEPARLAADQGRWGRFVHAMGGIDAQRKDHLIKLRHLVKEAASKYGEDVKKLHGLVAADVTVCVHGVTTGVMVLAAELQTRHQGWELSRTGLGERSELPLSGDSRAPWSSDNNCTQGSASAETDPLTRDLALLGLDQVDLARLQAGAVVTIDGLFVSIRNGSLNVSRQRPGSNAVRDPLADWAAQEIDAEQADRARRYRQAALQVLHREGDIEHWLRAVPEAHRQLARSQADELAEQMAREARWLAADLADDDFDDWAHDAF